jgi:hypothetical protein
VLRKKLPLFAKNKTKYDLISQAGMHTKDQGIRESDKSLECNTVVMAEAPMGYKDASKDE